MDVTDLVHAVTPGISARAAMFAIGMLTAGATSVRSCGFEDPNGIEGARGLLNWAYPNALYVTSAVWQAETAGILPSRAEAKTNEFAAYLRTISALKAFPRRLGLPTETKADAPSVSIVLVDKVLWSRFTYGPAGYAAKVHADGPADGDVVVVTEGAVIQALVNVRFSMKWATEMGLVRYYGDAAKIATVQGLFQQTRLATPVR